MFLEAWRAKYKKSYGKSIEEKKEDESWGNFLVCNPIPNATKEREITAYLSEYNNPFVIDKLDVSSWIHECEYTEKVMEKVEDEKFRALADGQIDIFDRNKFYILKAHEQTAMKIDEITTYFALNVDKYLKNQMGLDKSLKESKNNA